MSVPAWFPWHPAVWPALPPATWLAVLAVASPDAVALHTGCEDTAWTLSAALLSPESLPVPESRQWVVMVPGSAAQLRPPAGWHEVGGREILCWERHPERGVLHDPPLRCEAIPLTAYWELREAAKSDLPWPRSPDAVRRLARHVDLVAYAVREPASGATLALLCWQPSPHILHTVDVCWSPGASVRSLGRYLLQDMYLRHPDAQAILEFEPVGSPLSPVLMALGYRVYRRWWEHRWVREK